MQNTCDYRMDDEGNRCGKPSSQRSLVGEDPIGAATWCDAHAPAQARPLNPPDPNKDERL